MARTPGLIVPSAKLSVEDAGAAIKRNGEAAGYTPFDAEALSHSDQAAHLDVEEFIEHFGTKGMKWGVRKDRGHEGEQVKTKKLAKLDKKWEKNNSGMHAYFALHNRAAQLSNDRDIDRINKKPEHADINLDKDDWNSPKVQAYFKEHQDSFVANVRQAAKEMGVNPSGTKKIEIDADEDGNWGFRITDVKHADGDDFLDALVGRKVKVTYTGGKIAKLEFEDDKLEQSMALGGDFLAHWGVRGMKWGRRRSKEEISADRQQVEVKIKAGKGVVKTSGGKELQPHEDAINAKASKQRARASTTDALSNQELQALVTRMNLEQQYSRLAGPKERSLSAKGAAFLSKHLADDAINQPIRTLMSDVGTPAKGMSAYDKATVGAKLISPLLNPAKK